jgi:cysteine desulfurase
MKIYFDSAASTALHPDVLDEMIPFLTEHPGNPSSTHAFGRKMKAAIEQARKDIAQSINASPLEIIFTSCGTESNNLAIKGAVSKFNVQHLITSKIEHKCVLNTCLELETKGVNLHYVDVDEKGYFDLSHIESLLTNLEGKKMLSLMHANNEIGTINDIKAIGKICEKYDTLFHSDTVQTVAHYPLDVQDYKIHYISGSAHKFHGPKGVGFLYIRKDAKVDPEILGGGQERGFRSGTENVAGIVGMAKALDISNLHFEAHKSHILSLKKYFIEQLKIHIKEVAFNGDTENGLYTVLSVSFPPHFNSDMLLFNLDIAGIAVSGGSACSSGANIGSHVLHAINHSTERKALRFSFSYQNTKEEIDYTINFFKEMV